MRRSSSPSFPGSQWISPLLGTAVFVYGGWPFLTGLVAEVRVRAGTRVDVLLGVSLYKPKGALKGARAAAREACALRARGPVRVSPSWWAAETVDAARNDGGERCAGALLQTAVGILDLPLQSVEVRGEEIRVNGSALAADTWQRRSGARVLRRLFARLVAAHPHAVSRDELADELWPESEGDKAVRNLYAATKDLRRVLASARGVRLVARGGTYRLETDPGIMVHRN